MTLVVLALAWLGGMAAVGLWGVGAWYGLLVGLLASPAALARWGRQGALLALAAALVAFAGGWRLEAWTERPEPSLISLVGQELVLDGVIASEPDPGLTTTRYRVEVSAASEGGGAPVSAKGAVLITVSPFLEFLPGDRVTVAGTVSEAPVFEDFDYRGYLRRQGIVGTMLFPQVEVTGKDGAWWWQRAAARARLGMEASLQRALPEPEASLAAGIGFGRDANLSRELYDDFRDTGLAHIIAVSGSNVTYVAAFVFLLLTPVVGVRWATAPAAAMVAVYMVAAGLDWSVVRAGLMALIFLGGAVLGRQQSGLAALGAAAVVMTAWSPVAAFEAGFQLSLAATAGLIVFGPWIRWAMEEGLARAHLHGVVPGIFVYAAALSVAATITTLPLVWVIFGRVSLIGPVMNIVVEPLFVVAFGLALMTALAGLISGDLGWLVGLVAYYPLAFICWLAEAGARLPFAAVRVPRTDGDWAFVAYIAMGIAGWPAYRYLAPARLPRPRGQATRVARRMGASAAIGGVGAAVIVLSLLPMRGPGELQVAFLDVGQGDAILITTPGGERILIDGGPSGIRLVRELSGELPHWARTVDTVVLTHPQQDHLGGLPALFDRFRVRTVYDSGTTNTSLAFRAFEGATPGRAQLVAGMSFERDRVRFEVLWPPVDFSTRALNDASVVLAVRYGDVSFLLTGDIQRVPQRALLEAGIGADVLKVPHHGAATSLQEFLGSTGAVIAVIQVGEANPFGHPRSETLEGLDDIPVYRTDLHGRVVMTTDGQRVSVRTSR